MKRNILLGVGGGIAAYKAAVLASQLVQRGHAVRVAVTPAAQEFVGAVTFAGLTNQAPILSATQIDADGSPAHIRAAQNADLLIVAPATASLMARLAAGIAQDAVGLLALTCRCRKLVCPAMNDAMWEAAATQRNRQTLLDLGFAVLGPVVGHLAEGYDAIGRMVEPQAILDWVDADR